VTATSWQWSVIRRPVNSTADLSSTIVLNPFFSPDAQGLYTFRLVASGSDRSSITTVDLMATAAVASNTQRSHPCSYCSSASPWRWPDSQRID
jgi:hypothetical protein